MNRLFILQQKLATLEIILESLVDELIEEKLINSKRLDSRILERIKKLSEEIHNEKIELTEDEDDNFELSINGIPFYGKKGEA